MRLDIFTLCDSVQSYAGKLVVVGAMNVVRVPALPSMLANLALAVRLVFEYGDEILTKYQISIEKPSGVVLVETPKMDQSPKLPDKGDFTTVDFSFSINNVILDEEGEYVIRLCGDENVFETKFLVKKTNSKSRVSSES